MNEKQKVQKGCRNVKFQSGSSLKNNNNDSTKVRQC
jgi:hypothetical protein